MIFLDIHLSIDIFHQGRYLLFEFKRCGTLTQDNIWVVVRWHEDSTSLPNNFIDYSYAFGLRRATEKNADVVSLRASDFR